MKKIEIYKILKNNQDLKYKEFTSRLIPNIDPDAIIGVRMSILREISKTLIRNNNHELFLKSLPHQYLEEKQIHAILLSSKMDYLVLIKYINQFLPYIDNWATSDALNPKIQESDLDDFYHHILKWINSNHEYTVRFGVYMMMKNYLDKPNINEYLDEITKIKSDKYYINMMIAWTLAEALYINYEITIKYLEKKNLQNFVHNKTIQKAIESRKITKERKEYLKTLRV